jgi:hypothetical protein
MDGGALHYEREATGEVASDLAASLANGLGLVPCASVLRRGSRRAVGSQRRGSWGSSRLTATDECTSRHVPFEVEENV